MAGKCAHRPVSIDAWPLPLNVCHRSSPLANSQLTPAHLDASHYTCYSASASMTATASATNSRPSVNVHQCLQHTASNGRLIRCPLVPANASWCIRNCSMPITYNADGAPQCPSRPMRTHVLVHQESPGNDSTFEMHA
jgi:hypothetical protein